MKRVFLILTFGIIMSNSYGEEVRKLRFVYQDTDNYPFETGSGIEMPDDKPGISIEMITLMGKRLGIKIHFTRRPWKRCLVELEADNFDGLFNASYKASRLQYGVYPFKNGVVNQNKRSFTNAYSIFIHKSSDLLWDGKSLKKVKGFLGAPLGHSVADDLKYMDFKVHEEKGTFQNLRLLKDGYLSAVVDFEMSGEFYIKKYPHLFTDIIKIYPPFKRKHYYIMLSHRFVREYPELSDKIWNTIENIRKSELYREISSKY